MFARHTPTRMKGSGVVQGLRSLADKIHPQLPLTTKESSRLLTALTSSFRKHLDEAHPGLAEERPKTGKTGDAGLPKTNVHAMHSSAAFAQRHMASVLTNPLLVRGAPRLDYGIAKPELQSNPAKDPIQLLEEYDERGAATVRIAELCLEHAKREFDALSPENQSRFLETAEPGRRVFLWLLKSKLHDSSSYADNVKFIDLLVFFTLREGREENLWQWLKLDIAAPEGAEGLPANAVKSLGKRILYGYRWKGRLLCAMVAAKVGIFHLTFKGPSENIDIEGLNAGLDTLFKAIELKKAARSKASGTNDPGNMLFLPIGGAGVYLSKLLTRYTTVSFGRYTLDQSAVDVRRYEKLIDSTPEFFSDTHNPFWAEAEAAVLELFHPRNPSADRAITVARRLFDGHESSHRQEDLHIIGDKGLKGGYWTNFFSRCIFILEDERRNDEVAWMTGLFQTHFPSRAGNLNTMLQRYTDSSPNVVNATNESDLARIPLPSFA